MDEPFLSIVIPAYNEERRLPDCLARIAACLGRQPYAGEVIVADDGSADGTAAVAQRFAGSTTPVRVLRLPHRGKGHAVRAGMLEARGRYRFQCDADLAMPIEQIERFLPPKLQGVDVAVGSREAAGARRYHEPGYRHLMGRVFNALVRALAVRGVRDTQCGFKMFEARAARRLFAQQRLAGFGADVEILYLAQRSGLRVAEVPIDWYHQQESKVRAIPDTLAMLREVLQVRWNHLRGRYRFQPETPSGQHKE